MMNILFECQPENIKILVKQENDTLLVDKVQVTQSTINSEVRTFVKLYGFLENDKRRECLLLVG